MLIGGRYRLLSIAGQGGMAQVWRAELESIEGFRRPVAIKRILHHVSTNPEHRAMFIREARLTATLDHPNVVQVYDFGEDPEGLYLVLEWVEGLSLRDLMDLLARQKVAPSAALVAAIGIEILRGLEAAHENVLELPDGRSEPAPIIHRDISPSNVLLSVRGLTKVADFGLARAMHQSIAGMTPAGIVKGKLSYMAPEVLRGRPVSGQTDVYSVGVVLWEFLCGRRLYATEHDVIQSLVRSQRPPVVRMHRPETPTVLAEAIDRAVAPNPDERWATAGQFARALADALRTIPERTDRSRLAREMKSALAQWRRPSTGPSAPQVPRAVPPKEPAPVALAGATPPNAVRPPVPTVPPGPVAPPRGGRVPAVTLDEVAPEPPPPGALSNVYVDPSEARKLVAPADSVEVALEPASKALSVEVPAPASPESSHSIDVLFPSESRSTAHEELSAAAIEVLDLEQPPPLEPEPGSVVAPSLRESLVPVDPVLEPEAASQLMAVPLVRKNKPGEE